MKNENIKWLFLFLLGTQTVWCQNNLIPNYSFEQSNNTPECQYGMSNAKADDFDSDMVWWKAARHTPNKINPPDWIDKTDTSCMSSFISYFCNNYLYINFPSNRFVTLQSQGYYNFWNNLKYSHEAIRTQLYGTLQAGATYIIRMKVIPMRESTTDYGNSHLRVFFSKWGEHWNSGSSNNQLWEATGANIILDGTPLICQFQIIERRITVPSNMTDLQNIVLYAEDYRMAVDDVELFLECPSQITIQNQFYDYFAYGPNANQGTPFAEQASDYINAGNFGSGNVTVQGLSNPNPSYNARVTYTAGKKITLSPGFTAQKNSYFHAVIAPCPNNIRSSNIQINSALSDVINYNYPNENIEKDTLYCPTDTANVKLIYNNDTLGKQYRYNWNFGNGQSSTLARPKVYYGKTGTYTTTVIINDNKGFADTLSEQIIMLPCNMLNFFSNNKVASNSIKIFPNPNTGKFQITAFMNDTHKRIQRITIFDIRGTKVWEKLNASNQLFEVDISSQPKGIYYVKVIDDSGTVQVDKIINQ